MRFKNQKGSQIRLKNQRYCKCDLKSKGPQIRFKNQGTANAI